MHVPLHVVIQYMLVVLSKLLRVVLKTSASDVIPLCLLLKTESNLEVIIPLNYMTCTHACIHVHTHIHTCTEAAEIIRSVCLAVAHLHYMNIAHRDLKVIRSHHQ